MMIMKAFEFELISDDDHVLCSCRVDMDWTGLVICDVCE